MDKFKKRYGDWALVAGAAEGLGAAFSEILASWGLHVIMVDRDAGKMKVTAERLRDKYSVSIHEIESDLSDKLNVDTLVDQMKEMNCRLLIYNAAYGPVKDFLDNTVHELDYYVNLNSRTPLHLIYGFVKSLPPGQRSGILVMSSLAGLWGTQLVVPYGATKAFDYNLAEGLHYELKNRQIDVMACCAGATDTPNYQSTRPKKNLLGPNILDPLVVAEKSLKKLGKRALYIPGFSNQFTYFLLTRLLPRSFSAGIMNRVMYKMYRD